MDTVINSKNKITYAWLNILTCTPRGEKNELGFESYSLQEIESMLDGNDNFREDGMYLIDIANGHMSKLVEVTSLMKEKYPNVILMVGNIANPETYVELSNAGADYIRVGIGNGGGCFLENSLVITDKGEKLIQDIIIGDSVLTHTGEFKNVISTLQYPSRESLIKINDTISTKNHEYYVLNKKYEAIVNDDNIHNYAEWIEAEKLTDEYFLLEID